METCLGASTVSVTTTNIHKLKCKWNLWAHLPQEPDWSVKSYKKISQFKTAEEAIAVTETLPPDLVKNCMLFIMRNGITPMREDPKNRNGGCFSYKVSNKHVVDVWRDLTYVLVGESISTNPLFVKAVTGITISPKKNFCIVKVWTTNCDHQNPQIITSEVKNMLAQGCLFKQHNPLF